MSSGKNESLFRKEAVDSKLERLHGDILLTPRLSHTVVIGFLVIWVLILGGWLATGTYSQKETVKGWLDFPVGVIRIYPKQVGGMVESLLVEEGQIVEQGQPLVIVKANTVLRNGDKLSTELFNEYEEQRRRLAQQLDRQGVIASRREHSLEQKISAAKNELLLIDQQIKTAEKRRSLMNTQKKNAEQLRSLGYISAVELGGIEAQELVLQESLQELQRAVVRQSNLINEYKGELSLIPQQAKNTQDSLKDRLSVISQEITQLRGSESYTIVAPKAGIVSNLQVIEGEQVLVDRNVPLMSVLPQHVSLAVQLLVPVRSVGFLEEKQRLNIRYDAFPYQKFGMYEGEITYVSKALLLPNEVRNAPVGTGVPVYRVLAVLKDTTVEAYGKSFSLKPGMTLSADINLGDRTLIEWLFEPLLSLKGRL